MNRTAARLLALGVAASLPAASGARAEVAEPEPVVKAVFIERVSRFVEWPASREMHDASKPFVLCVLGASSMDHALRTVYATQTIRRKKVELRSIATAAEGASCHALVLGRSAVSPTKIIAELRFKPVLTIADREGYAALGVHLNFFVDPEKKVRFEINERRARDAGLYPSYRLLKLARIVVSPEDVSSP